MRLRQLLLWHRQQAAEAERVGSQALAQFHRHAASWVEWVLEQPTRKGFKEED
jgi:hypothetical protein